MARLTWKKSNKLPGRRSKPGVVKLFQSLFGKRSIIIISDHKTQHVPFSAALQLGIVLAVMTFVGWASFSSGSYMAAQKVLQEKERKLAQTSEENARVEAEFGLLKVDLMKLAQDGKNTKSVEVQKLLDEHYPEEGNSPAAQANAATEDKYSAVFKRIDFLENKVKDLQATHDALMADIRATTGGKIKELEQVIARTGMPGQTLERAAEAKRSQDEQRREKYGRIEKTGAVNNNNNNSSANSDAQGGPYEPVPKTSVLREKETELYFNLRRMMALNDIVTAMPLDAPMADNDYHQTSGFGTRVDPFRGVLGFHSGVDLAGHEGEKVVATNDGRVEFAGWKTAYGNVIDVKHEYGLSTRYAHLSRILVQPDQMVKKGQIIGVQGSTGRSTGAHVHYEVRYNGVAVNPGNFLKAGEDVRALD